jgi:two-component system cell cycle response regulator
MSNKRIFAVAMIGIPERERHILANIFKLSSYRPRSYELIGNRSEELAEIVLVDADDPSALAEWRALRTAKLDRTRPSAKALGRTAIPTVMVTKEKLSDSQSYHIRRPFVATRVLSVLDQMPIEQSNTAQENPVEESSKKAADRASANIQERSTYTALVVDDSLAVRRQLALELAQFDIQVEAVATGEEAFKALERKSFDLIFLDVVLPGVDGYQICETIKKDKLKKWTPVIMLTGKSSPFDRVRGIVSRCDTYLTKPVKQDSFHKVVKKYLSKNTSDS